MYAEAALSANKSALLLIEAPFHILISHPGTRYLATQKTRTTVEQRKDTMGQQDSGTSCLVGGVKWRLWLATHSDSVPDLCSTTAGANSFLPFTVVYRQGVNLGVNIIVISGLNAYSQFLKQSLEFSYTPTSGHLVYLQAAIDVLAMLSVCLPYP